MLGKPDLLVVGRIPNGSHTSVVGYVWEVKAPQHHVFDCDQHSKRLRASAELAKAESQLINYVESLSRDGNAKHFYGLDELGEFRAGGVIIGSTGRRINGLTNSTPEEVDRAYAYAHYVREKYLYRSTGMRLYTWDRIVDILKETENATPPTGG